MGYISYPRTSGGALSDRERQQIQEATKRKHGKNHLALAKTNNTKVSVEQALQIIKGLVGYPGTSAGTTVYYDPVRNISIVVSASGSIIGIYSGRINAKWNVAQLLEEQQSRIQAQRDEYERYKTKDNRSKPTFFSEPHTSYPTDERLPARAKSTAGMVNLELSWLPSKEQKKQDIENSYRLYDGYNDPYPYKPGTKVDLITLNKLQVFIRLHGETNANRPWVMTRETYEGHSLQELREIFSIPNDAVIDRVSEAKLPEGTKMRRGIANAYDKIGLPGGGNQYEIVASEFINRKIPRKFFKLMDMIN